MAVSARLKNRVIRAYTKAGHPIAYSTPNRVAAFFGIKPKVAKEILEYIEGYNLHREYKQPKYYNPYYVHNRRQIVQGDLIDVASIKDENDGIRFLLVLIDIFTKKLWVYPVKNKGQLAMEAAIQTWLNSLRVKPKIVQTDRGNEFINNRVQRVFRNHNVEWQACIGTFKAAVAERVNKTLQVLIYKYLTENETVRYIDVLPRLVLTYNKRGHRTLKNMSPKEADKIENEDDVQAIFHEKFYEIGKHRRAKLPFRVGDMVRIKTDPKKITSSSRAYAIQFQGEFFRIVRINRTLPIALYYLKSLDTGELIEGGFYANELQRQRGDVWKIEKVIREKTVRGKKKLFVKWRYFGDQWNEWIDEDQLRPVRG